ncbi:MAG: hypothetical protein NC203_09785 [Firmicutes bacterium]|nr:hypothetical protein [Bacillota bacterium]
MTDETRDNLIQALTLLAGAIPWINDFMAESNVQQAIAILQNEVFREDE